MTLEGERQHYLVNVRRLRPGDSVLCTDGSDRLASVTVRAVTERTITLMVDHELRNGMPHTAPSVEAGSISRGAELHAYLPLLKGRQFDRALRQLVELGVRHIVPVFTRHCVSKSDIAADERKRARRETILREACQQSGRTDLPVLGQLVPLATDPDAAIAGPGVVFHEKATTYLTDSDVERLRREEPVVRVLSGPEGGLADEEIAALRGARWIVRALPTPVLRAETAAVAASAIVFHILSRYTAGSV